MIENEQKAEDGTIKEPIKLRFKQLKDGNQSIYLDCYVNGIREYKFLNLYLRPDTSRDNKMWNKEQLRLANAIKWLPERSGQPASSRIFYKLPDQVNNADVRLRTIIKKAGISKHVTFHVARHTFATLTLTYGADLYTVSKRLGHSNIRTTQIYAKIVDESKRKAVNLIPKL